MGNARFGRDSGRHAEAFRGTLALALVLLCGVAGCKQRTQPPASPAAQAAVSDDGDLELPDILKLPDYEQPEPNGYVYFERLGKKLQRDREIRDLRDILPGSSGRAPTDADIEAMASVVEANAENLDELGPILDMEWLYPREATPWTLFPELAISRQFVRLLCSKAILEANEGRPDDAMPDLLQALRLGVKLPRGGTLIHWLCGMGCELMAFKELKPLVASQQLPESALQSVLASLDGLERERIPLREVIAFDYQRQGPGSLKLGAEKFWELLSQGRPFFLPLDSPKADKAADEFIRRYLPSLQAWDAAIAKLSTYPYYQIRDNIPDKPKGLPEGEAWVLAPVTANALYHEAALQCQWRAVRIMIHLELLRQKQGGYPGGLGQLKGMPAEELQDPFSGQSLVYRVRDEGYVLYSTGPDGADNGGKRGKGASRRDPGTDLILWPLRED